MIKHGYGGCPTCHADPSGGELLTRYGRLQGDLLLRSQYGTESDTPSKASGFLWGLYTPPEWLLLGGAYRHMFLFTEGSDPQTFPMQADLWAQARLGALRGAASVGISKLRPGSPYGRAAQVTTNPENQFNLLSRTHWIGWDFGAEKYTL